MEAHRTRQRRLEAAHWHFYPFVSPLMFPRTTMWSRHVKPGPVRRPEDFVGEYGPEPETPRRHALSDPCPGRGESKCGRLCANHRCYAHRGVWRECRRNLMRTANGQSRKDRFLSLT